MRHWKGDGMEMEGGLERKWRRVVKGNGKRDGRICQGKLEKEGLVEGSKWKKREGIGLAKEIGSMC